MKPDMQASGLHDGTLMEGKQSTAFADESQLWGPGPTSQGAWQGPATFCCPLAQASTHVLLALSGQGGGQGEEEEEEEEEEEGCLSKNTGESEGKLGRQIKNIFPGQTWHPGFFLVGGTGCCTLSWGHSSPSAWKCHQAQPSVETRTMGSEPQRST